MEKEQAGWPWLGVWGEFRRRRWRRRGSGLLVEPGVLLVKTRATGEVLEELASKLQGWAGLPRLGG